MTLLAGAGSGPAAQAYQALATEAIHEPPSPSRLVARPAIKRDDLEVLNNAACHQSLLNRSTFSFHFVRLTKDLILGWSSRMNWTPPRVSRSRKNCPKGVWPL